MYFQFEFKFHCNVRISTSSLKNGFNFVTQIFAKNWKMLFLNTQNIRFLSSTELHKHFQRSPLWLNFDLNSLGRFASLSLKVVSTSSLKYLQKTGKCSFQTPTIFVFGIKVAPKPLSKKVLMPKFWFKKILTLCLTFPENGFNLITQKFEEKWKMLFSNAQNIRFWA